MITLYICSKCECPSLVVWGTGEQLCRNCAAKRKGWNVDKVSGAGDRLIRVIMPTGKQIEMSVNSGEATVAVDGNKLVVGHSVLAGARRKIRA